VPQRGRLRIADFLAEDRSGGRLYRIEIDDELGSVKEGHFKVAEAPFLPGEEASFVGKLELFARDEAEADAALLQLRAGLGWIAAFGSEKTVGFGRTLAVEVAEKRNPVDVAQVVPDGAPTATLPLCVTFEEPVCFPAAQPVANLFESTDEIPGGALKGALATTLNLLAGRVPGAPVGEECARQLHRWKDLAVNLAAIRFTNAFPATAPEDGPAPRRPVRPPLSLVKWKDADGKTRLSDAAHAAGPFLLAGRAPEFAADWKEESDVLHGFGWACLKRELRVHTAIDPDTGAVKDGVLFALEMLRPEAVTWRGLALLHGVPEDRRAAVAAQLRDLLTTIGLRRVGKTDAHAKVSIPENDPGNAVVSGSSASQEGLFVLTLQSDVLLGDPATLPPGAGARDLRSFYETAWHGLSGGRLRLVRFFARQRLLGGRYLWKRFRPGKPYAPWLLTTAGSVFVVHAPGDAEQAQAMIGEWLKKGLPVPNGLGGGEPKWKTCPFVPENGWGEIALDLSVHRDWNAAGEATYTEVGFPAVWDRNAGPEGGAA